MSSIPHAGGNCQSVLSESAVAKFFKSLATFFGYKSKTRTPRIYHGDYSCQSMPDKAFIDIMQMKHVTFMETGDCYVYIFDEPKYQGNYITAGPKEVVPLCKCGSMIISPEKLPAVRMIQTACVPVPGIH
ncbi:MAG: hypothetical protein K6T65_02095 [Peptococcaceae bacterium]|nr:hypothetical protein [Peptococcaceae bacterium]